MKANDFITIIGDMLGEDFTYNVIWTRSDILSYLRKTLRRFSELTMIVDRDSLRYVSATTGESSVSKEFMNAYYALFDKKMVDIVQIGELDFVTDDWTLGTTGTQPLAATVMGSGRDATVRLTPVPNSGIGPLGGLDTYTIEDAGGGLWDINVSDDGVLYTTVLAGGTSTTIVLSGRGTYWTLGAELDGTLTTTAAGATTTIAPLLYSDNNTPWRIRTDTVGVIQTDPGGEGKVVRLQINDVDQDFTSDLGTCVDAYAQASATTPSDVVRLDEPYGVTGGARSSPGMLHLWYKGLVEDTRNTEAQIYLTDCYLPIIQHGVLALAYSHDGQGRDIKKAKVLDMIFKVECESVKRIFNRK